MSLRGREVLRWVVRVACLGLAVFFALGGPLPVWSARIVPQLSPLVTIADTLAGRRWYAGLFWWGPALLVLIGALLGGRVFCRWSCPLGTLYSTAGAVSARKSLFRRPVHGVIFWAIVFSSLVGFPVFLGLDPLSTINRFSPLLRGTVNLASLIPGVVVPIFLVLSFIQPAVWCSHFCPLGYFFDLLHLRGRKTTLVQSRTRRDVLVGLGIGLPLGVLGRFCGVRTSAAAAVGAEYPILPPGAAGPRQFAALCTRCYACVRVCPTKVITVRMPNLARRVGQWFHPELNTDRAACEQFCTACIQVCPAGAILPLTEEKKQTRKIGTAVVRHDACLAWADGEHCMVCQEFCPYFAITEEPGPDGVPCPVVHVDVCRGCGACEAECPAIRAGKAIRVQGVATQSQARQA